MHSVCALSISVGLKHDTSCVLKNEERRGEIGGMMRWGSVQKHSRESKTDFAATFFADFRVLKLLRSVAALF